MDDTVWRKASVLSVALGLCAAACGPAVSVSSDAGSSGPGSSSTMELSTAGSVTSQGSTTSGGPVVTTFGPSSDGPGSDSTDSTETGRSGDTTSGDTTASTTGPPEPFEPPGLVMLMGPPAEPSFVTVRFPDGEIESLEGGSYMLSLDGQHVLRTVPNLPEGFARDMFDPSALLAGAVTPVSMPQTWSDIIFIGPSFIVGELQAGGFERAEFDGSSATAYTIAEYPTSPMVNDTGDVLSGCILDPDPTLHTWSVQDDGLLELWATAIPVDDCPTPLGIAGDGTSYLATTSDVGFETCLPFVPGGALLPSQDFPEGGSYRLLGRAFGDDELLLGDLNDPTTAYVLGSDCTFIETVQSENVTVANLRLNPNGDVFAAVSVEPGMPAVLEFGLYETMEDVLVLPLGEAVAPATPLLRVQTQ